MTVHSEFELKYQFTRDPWRAADNPEYYQAWTAFIRRWMGNSRSALDCGCGEGHFTASLFDFCTEVHGIDGSKTAIERARSRYPTLQWHDGDLRDITKLDFSPESFDLITCSQVLYYLAWTDAAAVLNKLETILRVDGVLCVAAHCPGDKYFSPEELRALVDEPFQIISEENFGPHVFLAAKRRPA